MSIREEQWRAILQSVLAQYDRSNAKTLALAAILSWEQLISELTPLLGPESVCLIYRRSLDMNKSLFPWLPIAPSEGRLNAYFEALRRSLELQSADQIMGASFGLLYTFIDVLAALIGERLATDILGSAFPSHVLTEQGKEMQ